LTCWDPITHGYSIIFHKSGILSYTSTKTLEKCCSRIYLSQNLILWHLRHMLKEASKHLCITAVVLLTLSPTPSTSSVMKADPPCPGPSASLVENEETPEGKEGDLDTPEPAAERDIQIEYSCF
jgi:hypothetical protein